MCWSFWQCAMSLVHADVSGDLTSAYLRHFFSPFGIFQIELGDLHIGGIDRSWNFCSVRFRNRDSLDNQERPSGINIIDEPLRPCSISPEYLYGITLHDPDGPSLVLRPEFIGEGSTDEFSAEVRGGIIARLALFSWLCTLNSYHIPHTSHNHRCHRSNLWKALSDFPCNRTFYLCTPWLVLLIDNHHG